MDSIFITPVALWKNFDPNERPLATNVVKEVSGKRFNVREVYFNGSATADFHIRGYGQFVYIDDKPRPTVLILRSGDRNLELEDYKYYIDEGYNFFLLDYLGDRGQGGRFTLYPPERSFSNYTDRKTLYMAENGANNTCWYDWAVLTSRAISVLISFFEVKSSCIIVHGEKEGGAIAWIMAAIEERIAGSIALFEAGWNAVSNIEDDPTGARAAYIAALSPQAYAQIAKKPILFLGASNERGMALERINDTVMRLPAEVSAYISIAPRLSGQLNIDNMRTGLLFIKQCISGEEILPKRPTISSKASEGKLYYTVKAANFDDIKRISIYYAADESNPEIRNWSELLPESVGEGEYIAKAIIFNADAAIYAFANVEYQNGATLSTAALVRTPKTMGIAGGLMSKSRLFYDKAMGTDSFFAVNEGLISHGVRIEEGPMHLNGITTHDGMLATYKTNDPRFKGDDKTTLQLIVYWSPWAKTDDLESVKGNLVFVAEERVGSSTKRYIAKRELAGAEFWQKLILPTSDFKTQEGATLSGWENVSFLGIDGRLLVNSIIWV